MRSRQHFPVKMLNAGEQASKKGCHGDPQPYLPVGLFPQTALSGQESSSSRLIRWEMGSKRKRQPHFPVNCWLLKAFVKRKKSALPNQTTPKSPLITPFLPHCACGSGRFHRTSQSIKPHLPVTSAALPSCIHGTSRSGFQHFPVLLNIEARCSSC